MKNILVPYHLKPNFLRRNFKLTYSIFIILATIFILSLSCTNRKENVLAVVGDRTINENQCAGERICDLGV